MDAQAGQESQTQEDTQASAGLAVVVSDLKRRAGSSRESLRGGKRTRISVVEEDVDIEE